MVGTVRATMSLDRSKDPSSATLPLGAFVTPSQSPAMGARSSAPSPHGSPGQGSKPGLRETDVTTTAEAQDAEYRRIMETCDKVAAMDAQLKSLRSDYNDLMQTQLLQAAELQSLRHHVATLQAEQLPQDEFKQLSNSVAALETQVKREELRADHGINFANFMAQGPRPQQVPVGAAQPHQAKAAPPQGPRDPALPFVPQHIPVAERPLYQGLRPVTTLLDPFRDVVDYRFYRLRDARQVLHDREILTLAQTKSQVSQLEPTLEAFDGKTPVRLLSLLATLVQTFDTIGSCEGAAVLVLPYFLKDGARSAYNAQVAPMARVAQPHGASWPFVTHALLKRYLQDSVLRAAYDKVVTAAQGASESEDVFADRVLDAARDCANVFSETELTNNFIRGLPATIRDTVTEQVLRLPEAERSDMTVVRRIATSEGNTWRARQAKSPARVRAPVSLVHQEMPGGAAPPPYGEGSVGEPDASSGLATDGTPAFWPFPGHADFRFSKHGLPSSPDEWDDPTFEAFEVVQQLEPLLLTTVSQAGLPEGRSEADVLRDLRAYGTPDRDVAAATTQVPILADDEIQLAWQVIPSDYWIKSCWTCRDKGHSTFTCPFLTPTQRIFFAFRYYHFQIAENPHVAAWLHETSPLRGRVRSSAPRGFEERGRRGWSGRGGWRQGRGGMRRGRGNPNPFPREWRQQVPQASGSFAPPMQAQSAPPAPPAHQHAAEPQHDPRRILRNPRHEQEQADHSAVQFEDDLAAAQPHDLAKNA